MINLYGLKISPFTAKVRSYLQYKSISYKEIFVTMLEQYNFIKKKTATMYIPVVSLDDGEVLQDSSAIIDHFEEENKSNLVTPSGPKQKLASALLEVYGDEWMVPFSCLHYRWNYPENYDYILPEFGRMAFRFAPKSIKYWIGNKLSMRFRSLMPKLGLTAEICEAVEQRHEMLLSLLNEHFQQHEYLLGDRPCLGDFALFGPLYAHLYLDPAPGKLMKDKAPYLASWVEKMADHPKSSGDFVANDEIPKMIERLLKIIIEDSIPLLLESARRVDDWAENNPNEKKLPGALSGMNFTLLDKKSTRVVATAPVWKLQRVLDCLKLNESTTSELLGIVGGSELLAYKQRARVVRKNNKVVLC